MAEASTNQDDVQRIELLEERLSVEKRVVTLGRVFVDTRVETKDHVVEAILQRDEVGVERVAIGRVVDTAPPIREEDGILIVPVVEERIVVQVQLILKEEIRIAKTTMAEKVRRAIPLRSEHATIRRVDEPDQVSAELPGGDDR